VGAESKLDRKQENKEERMKARFRKGMLVITLPVIDPPRPSKSGKRLLVATSRGFRRTSVRIGNKPVAVSVNASIHPDDQQGKKEPEISKKALRKRARKR
jgi:hypothetical protein